MKNTVLIVDDNRRNIDIIERLLRGDYDILTAESGEEALEVAERRRPDIVLLDIMMPGIGGYEVCRALRAKPGFAATKIIMVSAKAMVSERLEGYEAGADDYVTKPFDLDELEAKVQVYARLTSVEEARGTVAGLLGNLTDRIGPPLSYLRDATSLLEQDGSIQGRSRDLLKIATQSVSAIRATGDDVKLLAALELGERSPRPLPVQTEQLLKRTVEAVAWMRARTGVRVDTESSGAGLVVVDETLMVHALSALVDLAMQRCERDGFLTLKLHVQEDCEVSVRIGTPRFDEAGESGSETGLSFRIIDQVTALHGGELVRTSREEGRAGLRFRVPAGTPSVVVSEPATQS